ncbi:hypothetical protein ACQP2Y_12315 [Actinoplanes sp. CA-051413]|uniref:hypothetical protein n=1 Tax=Actinoplanes sp. CA-051413 TaxID=3239899 RepID=UPI003D961BE3
MARIVVRLRPTETVGELDVDAVAARVADLTRWRAEVVDTRLSDAPYLTVVATTEDIDDAAAAELRDALREPVAARAYLVSAVGREQPLEGAGTEDLRAAACATP